MTVVAVVGGGWSFRDVDHNKLRMLCNVIIGVNDAALQLTCKVDHIVSMDRLWTENRWKHLERLQRSSHIRRAALKNIRFGTPSEPSLEPPPWLSIFDCDISCTELSREPGKLHANNSGVCAINLAYQWRPGRLFLLGFDMCRSPQGTPYWHAPYPWAVAKGGTGARRYMEWAARFEHYAQQFRAIGCEVANISPTSAITAFPRYAASDWGLQR